MAVFAAIVSSTILRAFLAIRYFGFQGGDDWEIVSEALRAAVRLDYTPWTIRNLFVSNVVVAPLLKLAALFGVTSFATLAEIARWPFIVFCAVNIFLLYRLGTRWFDERAGALAAIVYAFHWIPLLYGSSEYPRTVAVTCILVAALFVERLPFLAGAFVGVAAATRYSEAVYVVAIVLLAFSLRRAMAIVAGFTVAFLLVVGGYEWLTWGRPFAALVEFVRYTIAEHASSSLTKVQPPWWYATSLPVWVAPALWPFFVPAWRASWQRIAATMIVPVVVLSAIAHKELRYLQVVIPFAMLFAAAGAIAWWPRRRAIISILIAIGIALQIARARHADERSMNAIRAARWMASHGARVVGLSQVWAYGGHIYLGNSIRIRDVGMPPTESDLAKSVAEADYIAIYRDNAAALRLTGFKREVTFDEGASRAVDVFTRQ